MIETQTKKYLEMQREMLKKQGTIGLKFVH